MKVLFCDAFNETWKYITKDSTGRCEQQPSFVQYFDYCKRQYFAEVLQKFHENNRQKLRQHFRKTISKVFHLRCT